MLSVLATVWLYAANKQVKNCHPITDFLLSEIARWFKFSSLHQDDFKILFKSLNDGCVEPSKLTTPSSTSWLIKGKCIFAILSQWEELKTYLNLVAGKERNYHGRTIMDMLSDVHNYLYLTFILPHIQDFESVNAAFQATNADPYKVFGDLDVLHKSLQLKIKNKLFGAKLEMCLKDSKLPAENEETIKGRRLYFLIKANSQLDKQRDDNSVIVTTLRLFQPQCLSQVRTAYKDFPKSFHDFVKDEDTAKLCSQYEKLPFVNWEKEFKSEIPTETVEFWAAMVKYENALGENCFRELAQIVLNISSVLICNAFVE